jgi:hypothetical protein
MTGQAMSFKVPENRIPEGIVQFSVLLDDNSVFARRLWSEYDAGKHQVPVKLFSQNLKIRENCTAEYKLPEKIDIPNFTGVNTLIAIKEPASRLDGFLPGLPGWTANSTIPVSKNEFLEWLKNNQYPDSCVQAFFKAGSTAPRYPGQLNEPPLDQPGIIFFPETRAGILIGRVINKKTGNGVPSVGVGITILHGKVFNAVKTNFNGVFCFAFPGMHSSEDYILTFISEQDSALTIEVFSEYDSRPFHPAKTEFYLSPEELRFAKNMNFNRQLSQIYEQPSSKEVIQTDTLVSDKPFYDPPDRTIYTDNYVELANMAEVVYEVVPDVQVHRKQNQALLSVYSKNPSAHGYETLILLDGIPLTSHKELLDLPPTRIKAVEVKNKVYIHGNYIFSAVVNFISRNGDFAGLRLPFQSVLGSVRLPATGDQADPGIIGITSASVPLLNPVLLWDTRKSASTGKIEFSTNDLYGDFRISVYGFGPEGDWFFGEKDFSVIPNIP